MSSDDMNTKEEFLSYIEDCEFNSGKLTEWEKGFIPSIRSQLESGRQLSAKQVERLKVIWEKATDPWEGNSTY